MDTLRERVQNALTDDPRTRDAGIEIINENGIITLGGIVPDPKVSSAAEAITENVDGVVSVINEIQAREGFDDDADDIAEEFKDEDDPYDVSGTLDEDIVVK